MIPLKIAVYNYQTESWSDTKDLWEIMEPDGAYGETEEQKTQYALKRCMFPSEVKLTSQTYCRDADRTANYELENITNVNAKAKPEFTWYLLRIEYVQRLLAFLGYNYNYKIQGNIVPQKAPLIRITYMDFLEERTIEAYLGQTIDGTLKEYEGITYDPQSGAQSSGKVQYWENFRLAFPER